MNSRSNAMTLVELLIVLMIIGMLVAMMLPARSSRRTRGTIIPCMNNLHQIGKGFGMFALEHSDRFPSQASTNGGAAELGGPNVASGYFRTFSPYLPNPAMFTCPADKARPPATNFNAMSDANVSYFASLDATPMLMEAILAGDRNLEVGGSVVQPGLLLLTTNVAVGWARDLHSKTMGHPCGNMLFVDGAR